MKYRIVLTKVHWDSNMGLPVLTHRQPIRAFTVNTTTNQEIELLYLLTSPQSAFHRFLTTRQPDGHYLVAVSKQAVFNPGYFSYYGYAVVRKIKDIIFWENKYLQVGNLNPLNLMTRDPQEEVKRTNWSKVPGTIALKEPTLEERLDSRKGVHR